MGQVAPVGTDEDRCLANNMLDESRRELNGTSRDPIRRLEYHIAVSNVLRHASCRETVACNPQAASCTIEAANWSARIEHKVFRLIT